MHWEISKLDAKIDKFDAKIDKLTETVTCVRIEVAKLSPVAVKVCVWGGRCFLLTAIAFRGRAWGGEGAEGLLDARQLPVPSWPSSHSLPGCSTALYQLPSKKGPGLFRPLATVMMPCVPQACLASAPAPGAYAWGVRGGSWGNTPRGPEAIADGVKNPGFILVVIAENPQIICEVDVVAICEFGTRVKGGMGQVRVRSRPVLGGLPGACGTTRI